MIVWFVMRELPLQNKNFYLLRIALFNRIHEFSRLEGINFACFIVQGGAKTCTRYSSAFIIIVKAELKHAQDIAVHV